MVNINLNHNLARVSSQWPMWRRETFVVIEGDWESGEIRTREDRCGVMIRYGVYAGRRCPQRAGQGTDHKGYGECMAHGGVKRRGRMRAGWIMAHQFAEELDVSPWEALLMVIRITAGRVRYCEQVLRGANDDRELEGRIGVEEMPTGVIVGGANDGLVTTGRNLSWWVDTSERERDRLARVSKAAIDAGVAQLLIEKELRAGEELAGSYVKSLEAMRDAGMPEESLEIARTVMRRELQLALES